MVQLKTKDRHPALFLNTVLKERASSVQTEKQLWTKTPLKVQENESHMTMSNMEYKGQITRRVIIGKKWMRSWIASSWTMDACHNNISKGQIGNLLFENGINDTEISDIRWERMIKIIIRKNEMTELGYLNLKNHFRNEY